MAGTFVALLALPVAGATAAFAILDPIVIRSLPFSNADRLFALSQVLPTGQRVGVSGPDVRTWQNVSRAFDMIAVYDEVTLLIDTPRGGQRVDGAEVSANLYAALGVQAAFGRLFGSVENRPGGAPVVVLGDGAARRWFAAPQAAIGQRLAIGNKA